MPIRRLFDDEPRDDRPAFGERHADEHERQDFAEHAGVAAHGDDATGGGDALVTIWDLDDLVCLRTYARMDMPVRTVSISHDSRYLAYASEDSTIGIVSVQTGV